ncbi:MAG: DUF501 domain-containing protein [Fretibacterium sp.]|nr:DUF501 domain-containing protein [Fretibacterium sp.]
MLVCAPVPGMRPNALRPFPTTFWLVCPWLLRRAGSVESDGGVHRLEEWLSSRAPGPWREYNRFHQRLRLSLMSPAQLNFLRRFHPNIFRSLRLGGVGGIRSRYGEVRVKCLHLQTASWLALGHHPGAEWLRAEGLNGDCEGQGCPSANGGAGCARLPLAEGQGCPSANGGAGCARLLLAEGKGCPGAGIGQGVS